MNIADLNTPQVLIDLDVMERNVADMAALAQAQGVALRPHLKTHKIPDLAKRQLAAGAVGGTVAKVSEAEIMAQAGVEDLFIANELAGKDRLAHVLALSERVRLAVGVDSLPGAKALSDVFAAAGRTLDVLIEINSGLNRCGVRPGEEAWTLAQQVVGLPGLALRGVFTHAGHAYGAASREEVEQIGRLEGECVVQTAERLRDQGIPCEVVSVGSTPTAKVSGAVPGVTELRPGNYIFHDAMQLALGTCSLAQCALTVLATIISRPAPDRAVIDAGSKVFALDRIAHETEAIRGLGYVLDQEGVILERLSEEHGVLSLPPDSELSYGDRLRIIPNHACPVVNLFDRVFGVRGETVEEVFEVAARGRVW